MRADFAAILEAGFSELDRIHDEWRRSPRPGGPQGPIGPSGPGEILTPAARLYNLCWPYSEALEWWWEKRRNGGTNPGCLTIARRDQEADLQRRAQGLPQRGAIGHLVTGRCPPGCATCDAEATP